MLIVWLVHPCADWYMGGSLLQIVFWCSFFPHLSDSEWHWSDRKPSFQSQLYFPSGYAVQAGQYWCEAWMLMLAWTSYLQVKIPTILPQAEDSNLQNKAFSEQRSCKKGLWSKYQSNLLHIHVKYKIANWWELLVFLCSCFKGAKYKFPHIQTWSPSSLFSFSPPFCFSLPISKTAYVPFYNLLP